MGQDRSKINNRNKEVILVFTEDFIRESVLPEIEATGGATVLASPYGMPPAILRMDKYQPPTWIVGMGCMPAKVSPDLRTNLIVVTSMSNGVLDMVQRNAWSAVGYWVNPDGELLIEPVETYTNHYMAIQAGREHGQEAIYALHSGRVEFLLPARGAGALVPVADR